MLFCFLILFEAALLVIKFSFSYSILFRRKLKQKPREYGIVEMCSREGGLKIYTHILQEFRVNIQKSLYLCSSSTASFFRRFSYTF